MSQQHSEPPKNTLATAKQYAKKTAGHINN